MVKKILMALGLGCALSVVDIILCIIYSYWNLSFYLIFLGAIGMFVSGLSLWSPIGGARMNMYERRTLDLYSDNPEGRRKNMQREKKLEKSTSLIILSFTIPILVIPILTDVLHHVP